MSELIDLSARDAVRHLKHGDVRPEELLEAALERLAEVEPSVNAVPTVCADRALAQAAAADPSTVLAGLPIVVKDLHEVGGVRTTMGSPIFQDHVPERSDVGVARIERNGAVVLGKSNTPEFGAGANTFNEVFGVTRNPWDTSRSCAGSSGGAAVALATGTAWLADGSDLGGSLRNPAAFTGVVGLRPSPGRVPSDKEANRFQTLSVRGPMARDVRDCALMLDAMCGFEPRDPLSFDTPTTPFAAAVERPPSLGRVAFSADLGGITPVDPEVAAICAAAAGRFADHGVEVVEATPDFGAAVPTFTVLRAALFATNMAPLLESHRDQLKPEVVWNIEKGLGLSADDIGSAERARSAMHGSLLDLLDDCDLLLCPAAICPAYPVEWRYLEELNGHRFATYVDWLAIAFAISMTGAPALSLPVGLTAAGLPVGLQLVGRPRGEADLLAAAALLEDTIGRLSTKPIDPRAPGDR
ncbi:MAG: amidase family protein [Pseudomonadota bacterium]